jgi:hypothetical protein
MIKVIAFDLIDTLKSLLFPVGSFDNKKIKEFNDNVEYLNRVGRNVEVKLAALTIHKGIYKGR